MATTAMQQQQLVVGRRRPSSCCCCLLVAVCLAAFAVVPSASQPSLTVATPSMCDFYPGVSCGDPRFTGADGNNFYFHGKTDQDFCVVSDAHLHINAHFIGKRNPAMSRDFTSWIQALGIRFAHHRLYVGAVGAAHRAGALRHQDRAGQHRRRRAQGRLPHHGQRRAHHAREDSRIHSYGVTDDDSLAHLDLGFKFYDLTDDVHGVLGQTYRPDYVNKLYVTSNMPVLGGAPDYLSSGLFSADCAVARFGRRQEAAAASIGGPAIVAMVTDDME
ncbi:uncharacterized protein C2845_PM07G35950 [Panicum miliaceum]|uniref:Uncharacterized protein n=1 Tax=Panicum miliaceum TaxID=4540 RepID=A0A3L6SM65_PANMI|nr:uncharacterized protein C2845_PM07G35950 [Panicum miliaceum]